MVPGLDGRSGVFHDEQPCRAPRNIPEVRRIQRVLSLRTRGPRVGSTLGRSRPAHRMDASRHRRSSAQSHIRTFLRQQFRYGAGAIDFRAARRRAQVRSTVRFEGLRFHLGLVAAPFRQHGERRLQLAALLISAQAVYASGSLREGLSCASGRARRFYDSVTGHSLFLRLLTNGQFMAGTSSVRPSRLPSVVVCHFQREAVGCAIETPAGPIAHPSNRPAATETGSQVKDQVR